MLALLGLASAQETLPLLGDGKAPETVAELWAGYDPRAEPLEVEVLREWVQDGVVLKVLRYRIGLFKGRKAMMAAVYGHPLGARGLPGLVQIHGGGQYAHANAVLTNAQRGYATISIAWAGRIDAPGYRVTPKEVQLFWDGAIDDPAYKVTTDWGALDAYHAPSRNPKNQFPTIPAPAEWTLDPVKSPRNNGWFLCTLAARRALTFLEQQPEVDAARLGVYGHSMGGKLTVLTAGADDRVKAAAPSCGGVSDRYNEDALFRATLGDDVYLRRISCPIVFLSPSNDFHGRIDDLQTAVTEIRSRDWRVTCSPHHNHQDTADYEVATQLWFDQHLKGSFAWPRSPQAGLDLAAPGGIPTLTVVPDAARPVLAVEIFYTQHGQADGRKDIRDNTVSRFWHRAASAVQDGVWTAKLPVFSTDQPLWVYANVVYPLEQEITGAGYYYRNYTTKQFNVSSLMTMVTPAELKAAGVRATRQRSLLIESFASGWEKDWFSYRPETWPRRTHKIYDPQWAGPPGAKLAFAVRSEEPNTLVVGLDGSAAEVQLRGGGAWQEIVLAADAFKNAAGQPLADWTDLKELRLGDQETLRSGSRSAETSRNVGAKWNGPAPVFRNLRWNVPEAKL